MKIYFDVGANQGQDTEIFLQNPENKVFCFEPIPKLILMLYKKFEKYDNFFLLPFAVDIENSWKKFNISELGDFGCSSLYEFSEDINIKWPGRGDFNYTSSIKNMMCIRLDTFMNLYNIQKIDYLHVDAQGNDFKVLQSLGEKIYDVEAGVCEASNRVELYKSENNTVNFIKPWLELRGFKTKIQYDGIGKHLATVNGNEINIYFNR